MHISLRDLTLQLDDAGRFVEVTGVSWPFGVLRLGELIHANEPFLTELWIIYGKKQAHLGAGLHAGRFLKEQVRRGGGFRVLLLTGMVELEYRKNLWTSSISMSEVTLEVDRNFMARAQRFISRNQFRS